MNNLILYLSLYAASVTFILLFVGSLLWKARQNVKTLNDKWEAKSAALKARIQNDLSTKSTKDIFDALDAGQYNDLLR